MKIKLQRKITVEACASIMEVGKFREEYLTFLPVLQLSEEGNLTASEVNTKLFSTAKEDPRGRLLLERLAEYRLICVSQYPVEIASENDSPPSTTALKQYTLTSSGEQFISLLKTPRINLLSRKFSQNTINLMIELELITNSFEVLAYQLTENGLIVARWNWPKTPSDDKEREILEKFIELELVEQMDDSSSLVSLSPDETYTLTDLGFQFVPTLGQYFFNFSSVDKKIMESLANLGILIEDSSNSRGLFATDESREIADWSWPRKIITLREQKIIKSFKELGLVTPTNGGNRQQPIPPENRKTEPAYELTETGRMALSQGMIPVPEKGVQIIHGSPELLLTNPIISCRDEKGETTFNPQRIANNDRRSNGSNFQSHADFSWLTTMRNKLSAGPIVIQVPAEKNAPLQIISLDKEIEPVNPKFTASVRLLIEEGKEPEFVLKLNLTSKKMGEQNEQEGISVDFRFPRDFRDVVRSIFRDYVEDLYEDEEGFALLVTFDEVKDIPAAINGCRMDYPVHNPKIEDYGTFDNFVIHDMRVLPKSLVDAARWSEMCLKDQIPYYITQTRYEEIRHDAARMWEPRFSEEEIIRSLPSYDDALEECKRQKANDPDHYWYLTVPHILSMKGGI